MNGQMNMFDLTMPMISVENKIRLIELFAGYGSQAMALDEMGVNYEHYKVVEFDKYAIKSYNAVHGTCFEPSDIRDIRGNDLEILYTDLFTYLLTYSFPCTDLSVAGKMQGMSKGSGTRSGLLWEVERILTEIHESGGELPQILFMENVPQVLSSANIKDFHAWQDFLVSLGYTNHVQILNAKDYGVAQNRERAFMFSFLGEFNYKFPEPIPLTKTMKDYLEDEVDEKYYINSEKANKLITQLIDNGDIPKENIQPCYANYNRIDKQSDIAKTLCARDYKGFGTGFDTMNEVIVKQVGNIADEKNFENPQTGIVYDTNGIAPTLNTCSGGGHEPKICVDLSIKNPSENNVANCITSRENRGISNQQSVGNGVIVAMRGRNPQNPSDRTTGAPTEQRLEPNSQGLCNTITSVQKDNLVLESAILAPKRTDYGKEIRKAYESGVVKESRHNMTQLEPRTDGISNTLTTVQKDNLVLENIIIGGDQKNQSIKRDGICTTPCSAMGTGGGYVPMIPTIKIKQAAKEGYIDCKIGGVADLSFPIESIYRIRKLTPRECGRLMGVSDDNITRLIISSSDRAKDFFKMCEEKGIRYKGKREFDEAERIQRMSNSQLYKQFGNSIVVLCMIAMFSNLNIQGLPRWDVIKQRYI